MAVPCEPRLSRSGLTRKLPEKNLLRHALASIAAYFITFSCYGSHLPGQLGAVDRNHNVPGTRLPDPHPKLRQHYENSLKQPRFEMDEDQRAVTLEAIREVCRHRHWQLLAAHIRTNHVHTVVDAGCELAPESVMNAFKSYASRAFNLREPQTKGKLRWARHGSTRYLVSSDEVEAAVRYVLEKQG